MTREEYKNVKIGKRYFHDSGKVIELQSEWSKDAELKEDSYLYTDIALPSGGAGFNLSNCEEWHEASIGNLQRNPVALGNMALMLIYDLNRELRDTTIL